MNQYLSFLVILIHSRYDLELSGFTVIAVPSPGFSGGGPYFRRVGPNFVSSGGGFTVSSPGFNGGGPRYFDGGGPSYFDGGGSKCLCATGCSYERKGIPRLYCGYNTRNFGILYSFIKKEGSYSLVCSKFCLE